VVESRNAEISGGKQLILTIKRSTISSVFKKEPRLSPGLPLDKSG
jgi:hypothetical protein